ncbi:citrate synthase [Plasmodium falciparum IGH-CR14]|uniref:Citrate synthase n=1 Tax=Plasmodium falciparum IGH-CR14 TaxID=580059 RepID=A0A0L1I7J3_PLAFA|nr:citrate synthase [Plasmodium falciparum IGH-CR14]
MEGIRYLSCNKILYKRTGSTKTLINSLRKRYVHNNFKKKTCEQVLNTVNKLHNEKRYFNFSCSFTKSSRWNICMNRHNSRFFSSNESNKNLYLENYANIRKHINSIDNEESVIMNILKEKTYECGLRNTITLITDTSILEKKKGILFRGKPVEKILREFPKWDNTCEYPMAEAMLWFLLTKEVPAVDDLKLLSRELYCRAKKIPQFVFDFIDNIPPFTHPMSQLVSTVSFLESLSLFKYKYSEGILKTDYWKYILEDAISLISQIQVIGAYIFKRTFINNDIRKGEGMNLDLDLDWSANFAKLIGYENKEVQDLLRLYFLLHSDHEGGNASAHVSHLIGSTLGNPYLSYSGCVIALSGPLHGLANQECLKFLLDIKKQLDDPIIQILEMCYKVIPGILSATGKVKNPYPNVDCSSGSVFHHYGIKYPEYYTVLFALSRSIGVMSQLVLSRGLMYPLERPKSVDIYNLRKICEKNYVKIEEYE